MAPTPQLAMLLGKISTPWKSPETLPLIQNLAPAFSFWSSTSVQGCPIPSLLNGKTEEEPRWFGGWFVLFIRV